MAITRLPTKYGQGHADAIAFFQDEILPLLIENKIVCLTVVGSIEGGDELRYEMTDSSGERHWNLKMLGQLTDAAHRLSHHIEEVR